MMTIRKTEQDIIRSATDLKKLAECLKNSFSFSYRTIREARKIIKAGPYIYYFDATTLLSYQSNLNYVEREELDDLMLPLYEKLSEENREAYKELCERRVLLKFLSCAPEEYRKCVIEKHTRPDFILIGNKRIGIEITELTTPYDRKIFSLARQIRENDLKNPDEIREHIRRYFRGFENEIKIIDLAGTPSVASQNIRIDANRIHFAEKIKEKHDKYAHDIDSFDEFIIVANAASGSGLEISSKEEVDEVINDLLAICPEVIDTTVAIAWREAEHQERTIFSWYRNKT